MKVLLDHDVPHRLRHDFPDEYEVYTAHYMEWSDLENGDLLRAVKDSGFSVLVTIDKKMGFQQNLSVVRAPGVVFLRTHPANLAGLRRLMPAVIEVLPSAARGWHLSVFR